MPWLPYPVHFLVSHRYERSSASEYWKNWHTRGVLTLGREKIADEAGPAHGFLARHSGVQMAFSAVVLGEFAEGFAETKSSTLELLISAAQVLDIDMETAWLYGFNARLLRKEGKLIRTNDLWIGCCALRHGVPLVSGNTGDFSRIQSLETVTY